MRESADLIFCAHRIFLLLVLIVGQTARAEMDFKELSDATINGRQFVQAGANPDLFLNFTLVTQQGAGWSKEVVASHLKSLESILETCHVGLGQVRMVNMSYANKNFSAPALDCTRFRDKIQKAYNCRSGPGTAHYEKTVQALAEKTEKYGRPALHLVSQLKRDFELAIAYSEHRDQGRKKLWVDRKVLSDPTPAERAQLTSFNSTLGTAWVGYHQQTDRQIISDVDGPRDGSDPKMAFIMAHEMLHLLGIPHIESDPPTIMSAGFKNTAATNDDLCQKVRASPVLHAAPSSGGGGEPSSSH